MPSEPLAANPFVDASGTPTPWRLQLLGRVQALGPAGSAIRAWPTRATAALLARLALSPRKSFAREELVELLWPGVDIERGRARLRQALSSLRQLLDGPNPGATSVLVASRQGVQLNAAALSCDALLFEHHILAGQAREAAALYAGELMPGHYEDWVLAERRRFEVLHESIAGLSRAAAPDVAAPRVRPHPACLPPAGAFPAYWNRAFGQEPWVEALGHRVQASRLVNLLGPGGSGKTRLAVATGRALAQARPPVFEQILFVPLAEVVEAEALWESLALALACEGTEAPERHVRARIGAGRMLLVLDNCEQLDEAGGSALAGLLAGCEGLHLLLTSRRRLGLGGEQVFELPGLAVPPGANPSLAPQALELPGLGAFPALGLFIDRARESRPDFHLTVHNAPALVELVRLLAGLPLAIELAASRLRALEPRELLLRLQQGFGTPQLDLLARAQAGTSAQARHASMRQVVAWSWRQLPNPLRDLLCAMAVFAAPATLEAVIQALAAFRPANPDAERGIEPEAVQAWIADAVDVSMIQVSRTGEGGSALYHLLPPVREYAHEQAQPAALRAVRSRLRHWLAACAARGLPGQRVALQPDLEQAWSLLMLSRADDAPREALALAVALQSEWSWRPASPAAQAVLQWALQQLPEDTPDALVSQGHYQLAGLNQMRADVAQALRHAERAVLSAPDERCLGLGLSMRGWIGLQSGAGVEVVRPQLEEALHLVRRSGDARALALVLRLHASLQLQCFEDHAAAARLLEEAVLLFEQQGDVAQACNRQVELALAWAWTGRAQAARALAEACVQRCRDLGLAMVMIYAQTGLGCVLLRLREPAAAASALEQAARAALRDNWSALCLPALLPLAQAWLHVGQAEQAARLLGHVLARWPATLGRFNRMDARAVRRTRRLLGQALGLAHSAAMIELGAVLCLQQISTRLVVADGRGTFDATGGAAIGATSGAIGGSNAGSDAGADAGAGAGQAPAQRQGLRVAPSPVFPLP